MTSELRRLDDRFDETNGLLRTLVGLRSLTRRLHSVVAEHADGDGRKLDPTDDAGVRFVLGLVALSRRLEAVTDATNHVPERSFDAAPLEGSLWR